MRLAVVGDMASSVSAAMPPRLPAPTAASPEARAASSASGSSGKSAWPTQGCHHFSGGMAGASPHMPRPQDLQAALLLVPTWHFTHKRPRTDMPTKDTQPHPASSPRECAFTRPDTIEGWVRWSRGAPAPPQDEDRIQTAGRARSAL